MTLTGSLLLKEKSVSTQAVDYILFNFITVKNTFVLLLLSLHLHISYLIIPCISDLISLY